MPIHSLHPEYTKNAPRWKMIRDCIDEDAVENNPAYVPEIEGRSDQENKEYIEGGFFYSVVWWTLVGMMGLVFRKPTISKVPESLQAMLDDVDGAGTSLEDQIRYACRENTSIGRGGLLVDYPNTDQVQSAHDEAALGLKWSINYFEAEQIINWREETVNGITRLSFVVLRGVHHLEVDRFESKELPLYRHLYLDDGGYRVDVYKAKVKEPKTNDDYNVESFEPKVKGERLKSIPFFWVGSEKNTSRICKAPFLSLAKTNLSHLKNSAALEDSVIMRPTLFMSGMTAEWIETLKKNNLFPFKMGSRSVLPLPLNGQVGLVESMADRTPIERLMAKKEQLMAVLGARNIDDKRQAEAVETHKIREGAKTSVLHTCVSNTQSVFISAYNFIADVQGLDKSEIQIEVNKVFFDQSLTSKEALEWMKVWQGSGMAAEDFHNIMQKGDAVRLNRSRDDIEDDLEEEGNRSTENMPETV